MPNLLDLLREGLGFGPTPEEIAKYKAIESTITPKSEILAGDPGTSPGLAMIPNAANLGRFKDLTRAVLRKIEKVPHEPTKIEQAVAWMTARHPKLMERVTVSSPPDRGTKFSGLYFGPERSIQITDYSKSSRQDLHTIPAYIDVLYHELGHHLHNTRFDRNYLGHQIDNVMAGINRIRRGVPYDRTNDFLETFADTVQKAGLKDVAKYNELHGLPKTEAWKGVSKDSGLLDMLRKLSQMGDLSRTLRGR